MLQSDPGSGLASSCHFINPVQCQLGQPKAFSKQQMRRDENGEE